MKGFIKKCFATIRIQILGLVSELQGPAITPNLSIRTLNFIKNISLINFSEASLVNHKAN